MTKDKMKDNAAAANIPAQKRRFLLTATITLVLVVAIVVFATLIAYRIPWAFDMTAGKIFTLSDQSRQVLAGLSDPVEIFAIYPRDGADPVVTSLLSEYAKASPMVDVKYIDAEREPSKLAAENLGVSAVTNGTIIVRSADKIKSVFAADMFQSTPEGNVFWGERELTGALRYVTAASMPKVYFLEGHDEASTSSELSKAKDALELAVYDVQPLSLMKAGRVPEDAAMVIVPSPRSDLSESEYKALEDYLANGGKAMFLVGPMNTTEMVLGNFNKLLNQFGIDIANNLVVEEDQYSHLSNNKLYLIPGYAYHTITRALAEAKRYMMLPIAQGLMIKDVDPEKITQEPLLASSPKSWMRTDPTIKSETQTGQDVAGPIPLGYAVTRQGKDAATGDSRIVAVGNATFIYNEDLDTGANRDFFLSGVRWLLGGRGEETISPRDRRRKADRAGHGFREAGGHQPAGAADDCICGRVVDLVPAEKPVKLGIRLGLLALVAVVLGGVYVSLSRDTEPTTTGFLYTFPSGDRLEEMRIVNQKGSVLLARKDGKWVITEPGAYRANQQKAGLMEDLLLALPIKRQLEGAAPEYGFDDPQATIEMTSTSGIRKAFLVGNLTASKAQVYLKDKDSGRVFVSDLGSVTQFDGSLDAYRDKDIFSVDKNNIVEFSYFVDGEKQVTAKHTNGQDWQLTYPYEAPAREIEINEFLIGLRKWSAIKYPTREQLDYKGLGLDRPQAGAGSRGRKGPRSAPRTRGGNGRSQVRPLGQRGGHRRHLRGDVNFSNLDAADLVFFQPLKTTIGQVASIELTEADKS